MRWCPLLPISVMAALAIPAGSLASGIPEIERRGPISEKAPTILAVHGGSWLLTGPGAMRSIDPAVRRWRKRGYSVFNVDYSPGMDGLGDLSRAFDQVVRERGRERLCLYGESAGGHLALMLAINREEVTCVIAVAAPLDLGSLGPELAPIARLVFGADPVQVRQWSPLHRAREIKAAVMLQAGVDDRLVPIAQQRRFVSSRPKTRFAFLRAGSRGWFHGSASRSSIRSALGTEARFAHANTKPRRMSAAQQSGRRVHSMATLRGDN